MPNAFMPRKRRTHQHCTWRRGLKCDGEQDEDDGELPADSIALKRSINEPSSKCPDIAAMERENSPYARSTRRAQVRGTRNGLRRYFWTSAHETSKAAGTRSAARYVAFTVIVIHGYFDSQKVIT